MTTTTHTTRHPRAAVRTTSAGQMGDALTAERIRHCCILSIAAVAMMALSVAIMIVAVAVLETGQAGTIPAAVLAVGAAFVGWRAQILRRVTDAEHRQRAGHQGEIATQDLTPELTRRGWHVMHDLLFARGRGNIDHLLITPDAQSLVVLNSKWWRIGKNGHRWGAYTSPDRHLMLGPDRTSSSSDFAEDRTRAVDAVIREAERVHEQADRDGMNGFSVVPAIVIHGSRVRDGVQYVTRRSEKTGEMVTVAVIAAERLVDTMNRAVTGTPDYVAANHVASWVVTTFPKAVTTPALKGLKGMLRRG